ncbi:hypothetical protein N0V83_000056 [Neocucurbitaria cava]|uniref:FAD-binding PCMH-type domain-containing protein n=1 Tax=Neocucurbitaria cava TaxID=798079 RepID=A0A9W8YHY4_9PLEO|nr:hypothetical protein N0V83_000056 [Neocucurbitaria cava]
MATFEHLKRALRKASVPQRPLSDEQYSDGFEILIQGLGQRTYNDFIVPQLTRLLETHFKSQEHISILEIGPGPCTVLAHLPNLSRRKIGTYTAFEPNLVFAKRLEKQLCPATTTDVELPFSCLGVSADVRWAPFDLRTNNDDDKRYDFVLFCHSMYGMEPRRAYIERALEMLHMQGLIVVFHRDGTLQFDGLVCHETASFPTGILCVEDNDEALDSFAAFIVGGNTNDQASWRTVCRDLCRQKNSHLEINAPEVMVAFNRHATALMDLTSDVSVVKDRKIKNRQARLHHHTVVVKPKMVGEVQQCVQWAIEHEIGLTVIGGGHSGHCLASNVVAVDMSAFDGVHVIEAKMKRREGEQEDQEFFPHLGPFIVAGAGSTTGDIIRIAMAPGLTVPLGSRPSVGAGLWLQGGIGHLARKLGLACDAIVGAIIVSVEFGEIFCVGHVPDQHVPVGAIHPESEADLLWAIKGAGTNFGIVINVTFRACTAPIYLTRKYIVPLDDAADARSRLREFDDFVAKKLDRNSSADAYLYCDKDKLQLGLTMIETFTSVNDVEAPANIVGGAGGSERGYKIVDGLDLFETEMYVSEMHGGHAGGKTSAFKRCVFLKNVGKKRIASRLVKSMDTRPTELCYLHLLQGGGAVSDVAADATAFGCRGWDFACVITGVWPSDQDDTELSGSVIEWVYDVAGDLLPFTCGAYGADLGPDPRDAALAAKAFGPNLRRLIQLKSDFDPKNVLAYTCPFPQASVPKLIILVTGESCAGKDYCANVWASAIIKANAHLSARTASISDATKREYAAANNADIRLLLEDRDYKELHRPKLTVFYQEQVQQRPSLPEEHFMDVVHDSVGIDVLLITGMRDEAPVPTFSHLVAESRLIEVRIQSTRETQRARGGVDKTENYGEEIIKDHCPSLTFHNDAAGSQAAETFAKHHLLSFVHPDLEELASMARSVLGFPRPGINFRHVLGISQHPGGLELCTNQLQQHFGGDWAKVSAIACCEVGGYVFASPLALRAGVPLRLIRKAGKLPPPHISVTKATSHISKNREEEKIEIERDAFGTGANVVVVDDVLATGETLCAVLGLLEKAGVATEDVSVMVIAEFPFHRGRDLLRQRGFGNVGVQSLLVFGGA